MVTFNGMSSREVVSVSESTEASYETIERAAYAMAAQLDREGEHIDPHTDLAISDLETVANAAGCSVDDLTRPNGKPAQAMRAGIARYMRDAWQ